MKSLSERRNFSFSQWLWHRTFEDCCNFTRRTKNPDEAPSLSQFLVFFFSKFLLEVCGAAGAVWGFFEMLDWRHEENTDDFREYVTITFVIFAVRFYWHVKHFWQHGYDIPYAELHHRRSHWFSGFQAFAAKFLLQVCGAAGAVWGASETTYLRHASNRDRWQIAALVTTLLFGIRWMIELFSYCLLCRRSRRSRFYIVLKNRIIPFVEVTVTKFVLEVCGSTGAVWGFADILTIRDKTPDSAWHWRVVALVIGSIFLMRWIWHIKEFLHLGEKPPLVTEPSRLELLPSSSSFESDEDESSSFESEKDEETAIITDQGKCGSSTEGSSFENEEDEETAIITEQGKYGSTSETTPLDDHEIA